MNIVTTAHAQSIALAHGALSLQEIVAWADQIILEMEEPPIELFNVSLANDINSGVEALKSFGNSNDIETVGKLVFKYFYSHLRSAKPNYDGIARGLYDMYLQEIAPMQPPLGEMAYYWDALDIAKQGHFGAVPEVKREILDLLELYKCE